MKTTSKLLIVIMVVTFTSCENKEVPNNYMPERQDLPVEIVKVIDPEQLQYVVADIVPVFSDTTYSPQGPILSGDSDEYKIRGIGGV